MRALSLAASVSPMAIPFHAIPQALPIVLRPPRRGLPDGRGPKLCAKRVGRRESRPISQRPARFRGGIDGLLAIGRRQAPRPQRQTPRQEPSCSRLISSRRRLSGRRGLRSLRAGRAPQTEMPLCGFSCSRGEEFGSHRAGRERPNSSARTHAGVECCLIKAGARRLCVRDRWQRAYDTQAGLTARARARYRRARLQPAPHTNCRLSRIRDRLIEMWARGRRSRAGKTARKRSRATSHVAFSGRALQWSEHDRLHYAALRTRPSRGGARPDIDRGCRPEARDSVSMRAARIGLVLTAAELELMNVTATGMASHGDHAAELRRRVRPPIPPPGGSTPSHRAADGRGRR